MRNTIVFIAWTLLLVILLLAAIAIYIVSTSDGTATYAQMGYATGRHFFIVLIGSVVVIVLGKNSGFLPGFTARRPTSDSSTTQH